LLKLRTLLGSSIRLGVELGLLCFEYYITIGIYVASHWGTTSPQYLSNIDRNSISITRQLISLTTSFVVYIARVESDIIIPLQDSPGVVLHNLSSDDFNKTLPMWYDYLPQLCKHYEPKKIFTPSPQFSRSRIKLRTKNEYIMLAKVLSVPTLQEVVV